MAGVLGVAPQQEERIGRYDLIAEIASGGMATVYLGRLSGVGGFHRTVAIKRLHPHLARNANFVQMFLDEARLAAMIHHPNVVPILEVGESEHGYYLVMEFIEGDTFAALLSRVANQGRRIPLSISIRVLADMLRGLHAAHELKDEHGRVIGLVHSDVSPQNILCSTDGITRITDFGVARAASQLGQTRSGQLKGKLAYMAPEQAGGDEIVDRRSDLFSSGVVLWEALAFKRLFKAQNDAATLSRVMNERIVSPRRLNREVPESIAAVCLKALQRDPARRFGSGAEFADALERAAYASGMWASPREVAEQVESELQDTVAEHRSAIREWKGRGRVPAHRTRPPPPRRTSSPAATAGVHLSAVPRSRPASGISSSREASPVSLDSAPQSERAGSELRASPEVASSRSIESSVVDLLPVDAGVEQALEIPLPGSIPSPTGAVLKPPPGAVRASSEAPAEFEPAPDPVVGGRAGGPAPSLTSSRPPVPRLQEAMVTDSSLTAPEASKSLSPVPPAPSRALSMGPSTPLPPPSPAPPALSQPFPPVRARPPAVPLAQPAGPSLEVPASGGYALRPTNSSKRLGIVAVSAVCLAGAAFFLLRPAQPVKVVAEESPANVAPAAQIEASKGAEAANRSAATSAPALSPSDVAPSAEVSSGPALREKTAVADPVNGPNDAVKPKPRTRTRPRYTRPAAERARPSGPSRSSAAEGDRPTKKRPTIGFDNPYQ